MLFASIAPSLIGCYSAYCRKLFTCIKNWTLISKQNDDKLFKSEIPSKVSVGSRSIRSEAPPGIVANLCNNAEADDFINAFMRIDKLYLYCPKS
jgi:hypothetical protein